MENRPEEREHGYTFDFVRQDQDVTLLDPVGPQHPPTILLHGPETLATRLHQLTD
ncbi:hypothetical protein [Streptomyces sp. NPDC056987]|uniref:hypothetical protein n=1 Tax=Streptomyces sp. NPDC056987 TaxID=3345988 RepID=UPI0036448577